MTTNVTIETPEVRKSYPINHSTLDLPKRKWLKLFSMFDTENCGAIKLASFEKIVHRLAQLRGWREDSLEYDALLRKFAYKWIAIRGNVEETNHHKIGNALGLEEWLRYYETCLREGNIEDEVQFLANIILDVLDLDESGNIDLSEWQTLYQVFQIPIIYAAGSFCEIDLNGDGRLTNDEIIPRLREFYVSEQPESPGNNLFGPF